MRLGVVEKYPSKARLSFLDNACAYAETSPREEYIDAALKDVDAALLKINEDCQPFVGNKPAIACIKNDGKYALLRSQKKLLEYIKNK